MVAADDLEPFTLKVEDEVSKEDSEEITVECTTVQTATCNYDTVTILCDALDKLIVLPEYTKGNSTNCKKVFQDLTVVRDSITNNKSNPCVIKFADALVTTLISISNHLKSGTMIGKKSKSLSTKTLVMWKAFHQYVSSYKFNEERETCLSCLKVGNLLCVAIISQHTACTILEALVCNLAAELEKNSSTADIASLSIEEENAIRYACGFIVRSLKNKLKMSPSNDLYIEVLDSMHEDDEENAMVIDDFFIYTKEWIKRVDRGGLFRVSDEAFLLFRWMEMCIRKHLMAVALTYLKLLKIYTVKNNVLGQHISSVLHVQGKIYSPHVLAQHTFKTR